MTPGQYKLALADLRSWQRVDIILRSGFFFKDIAAGDCETATQCVTLSDRNHRPAFVLVEEIAAITAGEGGEK